MQSANSSLGAKEALDNLEINLNEIAELNRISGKKPDVKMADAKKKDSIEKILSQP